jgi:hypothetical protein
MTQVAEPWLRGSSAPGISCEVGSETDDIISPTMTNCWAPMGLWPCCGAQMFDEACPVVEHKAKEEDRDALRVIFMPRRLREVLQAAINRSFLMAC